MSEVSEFPVSVLVLEKDARTIQIIQVNLGRFGYQVDTVANRTEALRSIRTRCPALLIASEALLGKISAEGSEFVRELRRDPDLADLPVIVLHAFPENGLSRPLTGDELKKGHRLGKPFNPQELLMIIRYTRSKGQNPKRVLIVENDEDVIALLRCCLGTEGYYITVVADGTEALERMQGDRPALLIIGDQPPGITGAEFVTLLRSDPALCMVPAIVLHCKYWTAEGKTWGNALQEGVHIQKPANPWEVRAYARRVLSSPN